MIKLNDTVRYYEGAELKLATVKERHVLPGTVNFRLDNGATKMESELVVVIPAGGYKIGDVVSYGGVECHILNPSVQDHRIDVSKLEFIRNDPNWKNPFSIGDVVEFNSRKTPNARIQSKIIAFGLMKIEMKNGYHRYPESVSHVPTPVPTPRPGDIVLIRAEIEYAEPGDKIVVMIGDVSVKIDRSTVVSVEKRALQVGDRCSVRRDGNACDGSILAINGDRVWFKPNAAGLAPFTAELKEIE